MHTVSCDLFALAHTKTETDTDQTIAWEKLDGNVHTAQRQIPAQTLIGFCTHFIGLCLSQYNHAIIELENALCFGQQEICHEQ